MVLSTQVASSLSQQTTGKVTTLLAAAAPLWIYTWVASGDLFQEVGSA